MHKSPVANPISWVQSCISSVGFPSTLGKLLLMADDNAALREWAADLDTILHFEPHWDLSWTAPRWIMQGDILFFYHTKKAKQQVAQLSRAANLLLQAGPHQNEYILPDYDQAYTVTAQEMESIVHLLDHASALAERYAGTLFACAVTGGSSVFIKDTDQAQHFRSTIFAPIERMHVFQNPLHADDFFDSVKIGQNTITPLFGNDFDIIHERLAKRNVLPDFLTNAKSGGLGFRGTNAHNWPMIACAADTRFLNEAQIRSYFIDFLLDEVKDRGTPRLIECECFRADQTTGIADYFVKVHGRWVPVEAKLNILAERDLLAQTQRYTSTNSFIPTKIPRKGERIHTTDTPFCIVIDTAGLYIVSGQEFIGCGPDAPLFRREQMNHTTIPDIRTAIATLLD